MVCLPFEAQAAPDASAISEATSVALGASIRHFVVAGPVGTLVFESTAQSLYMMCVV